MTKFLIFLITFYQLYSVAISELVNTPSIDSSESNESILNQADKRTVAQSNENQLDNGNTLVKSHDDRTEIDFEEPISSMNIDYARNAIILQFPKQRQKGFTEIEDKRQALNKNFIRFGRSNKSLMRFGKRQLELFNNQRQMISDVKNNRNERSEIPGLRDSRGDNFMRFGRSGTDFMRFGRSGNNNLMRFGRSGNNNLMRFGRANDFLRFGRQSNGNPNFMRLGRSNSIISSFRPDSAFKQFLQADSNSLRRSGRPDSFMRFGRGDMQFDKFDENYIKFLKQDNLSASNEVKNHKIKNLTTIDIPESNKQGDALNYVLNNEFDENDSNNNAQDYNTGFHY